MQRLGLGALGLVLGDGAGLDHRIEHQVAPLDGAVGMAEGIEVIGPLNHARQQRAFGQIELAHILAEVGLRRLAEAVDGKAAALAQVDLVGVHLEDLLLGEAVFKLEGDDDLDELALDALLRREKEAARQLHGQRGAALLLLAGSHVADDRLEQPPVVDAAVLKEAAVLDGQHGLHQIWRNLVVGDQAALGAVGVVAQAGDQQRLQFIAGQRLAVIVGDRLHHAGADADGGAVLRVIGLRAGAHGDGLHAFGVGSQLRSLRGAIGGVAGLAQFIGDELDGELLSGTHLARRGIDLGGVGKDGLFEPLVHDALILEVVKSEDDKDNEHNGRKRQQHHAQQQRRQGMLARETSVS